MEKALAQMLASRAFTLRRRWGWAGIAGAALLAAAALLAGVTPLVQRASQSRLDSLARSVEAQMRERGPRPAPALTPEQRVTAFVDHFPPPSRYVQDLQQIFDSAKRASVELPRADYATRSPPGSPFATCTIVLPVRSRYAAIKIFVGDLLATLPHASVDELRLTRPNAQGKDLDAIVRVTLYYRKA